ncbi:MAG: methyltransferase [Gemmatimonadaceae bacterium]
MRSRFLEASYDESTVARRLGGRNLIAVKRLVDGRTTLRGEVDDANAAFIRLFIDGEALPLELLRRLVGGEALDALSALALLVPAPADPESLEPTVQLCPTHGLLIASDLHPVTPNSEGVRQDFVYSANNELTTQFLSVIPDAPGARVLDMCAGTGVAALRAVKGGAASAVAADLVPRCVHFARFNARLNGFEDRVTVLESNAWSALEGELFDLVVAHPPYVPALAHRLDFRDAGEDGEDVTRRIIQGLPSHVRPGGRMILRAALSDRRGASIAQRVRGWLGAPEGEFDLVQLETLSYGPMEAYQSISKGLRDYVDCERWLRHFAALEVERFAICLLELRRDALGRAPMTERRVLGTAAHHRSTDWHFRWGRTMAERGSTSVERLAGLRPRVAPGARLAVHLEADAEGSWHTVGASVEVAWPSHNVVKAPALAPTLLELCDGTRDVSAVLGGLRSAGLVDEAVGLGEVAHLLEVLAAAGALELSICPLPAVPVTEA